MRVKLRAACCSIGHTAFLIGALTVLESTVVPEGARAEGPFDFLFGGLQRPTPPPDAPPSTVGRVTPPAQSQKRVSGNNGIGRSVGFCVRLCDGQYFRIRQLVHGTAEDTCTAICPYSKTKLFSGVRFEAPTPKTVNATPRSNRRSSTARNKWQTALVTVEILLAWFH